MQRTERGWDRVGTVADLSAGDVRNPLADDFGGRDVSAALHVGASSCCATPKPPEPHGANSRSCCFAATPDGIAAAQWIEIDADRPVGVERYRQYQPPRCSPANRKDGKNDPTICVIGGVAVWSRKRGRRQVRRLIELRFPTSSRAQLIVPVTVELVAMERQCVHLCVRRRHSFGVFSVVELGSDPQPGVGARITDQIDNGLEGP